MDNENDSGLPIFLQKLLEVLQRFTRIQIILVLVSAIAWTGTAFYCLKKYNQKHGNDLLRFVYITLMLSALNGSMAVIETCNENALSSMRSLLELLQAALSLPCLTTEVWLKYQVAQKEVAWVHAAVGLLPTYIFLFQHYTRQDLIDFAVVLNMVSLLGVGVIYADFYAAGASVLVFITYTLFFFRGDLSYEPIPRQFHNYCMALFTYCAYKSVT